MLGHDVEGHAFEIILEHEVYNPGHSVGTVYSGGTTGQHFHPLDKRRRDVVDVHGTTLGGWDGAGAIDEHEGPVGAEAAEVYRSRTVTGVVRGAVKARHHLRHGIEQLLGVHGRGQFDLIGAEGGHGGISDVVGTADARTGYHHFFELCFFSEGDLRQGAGASKSAGEGNGADGRRKRVLVKHIGSLFH